MRSDQLSRLFLCLIVALGLVGCASLNRQNSVPKALHGQVGIEGMPEVRYQTGSKAGIASMLKDVKTGMLATGFNRHAATANYLSISGGGDNGAFAAGLLSGWSAHGDRPHFELVTGVSTGALIAPFAYLGSDYDNVLRKVYTESSKTDIFFDRGLIAALFSDAMGDTTPLYSLISKYVDEELLAKIAHEYTVNDRWLLVATTNLDAGTPVIWNMGKIAAMGTKDSLILFRKIMLASAAIPGAFPPVMFDVIAAGNRYQELHVDGGASTEVFLYPTALGAEAVKHSVVDMAKKRQAFIIRNARLDSDWQETERSTFNIVTRAITQLIQSQAYGDLYRIYQTSKRDHIGFNLAYIGSDFDTPHNEDFNRTYMNALFQYGYQLAQNGYPWAHQPPGYNESMEEDVEKQVDKQRAILKFNAPPAVNTTQ